MQGNRKFGCLFEVLEQIPACLKKCSLYYRGEAKNYGETACKPRLFRNEKYRENERYFYNEAMRRCPDHCKPYTSRIENFALLQHYGFPTRLLDVTKNPLVALYFATRSALKTSGKLYCICVPHDCVHYQNNEEINTLLEAVTSKNSKKTGQTLAPLFVKPPFINERIRAQDSAMLLFYDKCKLIQDDKSKPIQREEDDNQPYILSVIDVTQKKELQDELRQLDICERTLFPELDHLALDICQHLKHS